MSASASRMVCRNNNHYPRCREHFLTPSAHPPHSPLRWIGAYPEFMPVGIQHRLDGLGELLAQYPFPERFGERGVLVHLLEYLSDSARGWSSWSIPHLWFQHLGCNFGFYRDRVPVGYSHTTPSPSPSFMYSLGRVPPPDRCDAVGAGLRAGDPSVPVVVPECGGSCVWSCWSCRVSVF